MGQYQSNFTVTDANAVTKHTNTNKPNWITLHALATELSIAETERLWFRFQQLGCNKDGEITEKIVEKEENPFTRIMVKKLMNQKKKVTFEIFIRALKWFETEKLEIKLRAIFVLLSSGKNVKKETFTKILEKVYTKPEDKKNLPRVANAFYEVIDTDKRDGISEDEFAQGVYRMVPEEVLQEILRFEILPNDMRQKLYDKLPEIATPVPSIYTQAATPPGTKQTARLNGKYPSATPLPSAINIQQPTPVPSINTMDASIRTPPRTANTINGSLAPPMTASNVPSDAQLRQLADKMHRRDWEKTANKLGMTQEETDEIRKESSRSPQQAFLMLQTWKRKEGPMARTNVLETALKDSGLQDLTPISASRIEF